MAETKLSQSGSSDVRTTPSIRAAEYVRMSTEHQKYSTENQSDAIRAYAEARGIEIVKTYADEGKSGLKIEGRDALKRLIDDVQNRNIDFETILVYDVSRWGRFQDADESAYYEYLCKRAGISVQYCAEQFENDGSPVATIVKGVKRAMAGEYSRELSAKVFAGQCRLIELGFRQGGAPGFGIRRSLVSDAGAIKSMLERGEQKSLQTDRVILVPGPPNEIEIVRWIYRAFVEHGKTERQIAWDLNFRGLKTDLGRHWTRGTVHQVLINEKYIGNNVWNHVSFKLKKKLVRNPPEMWVRSDHAFDPIVDESLFYAAQAVIRQRSRRATDDEMLAALTKLLEATGHLSGLIIDEAEGTPSSSAYLSRFGSLIRAYQLIGYAPDRDYRYLEINRVFRTLYPSIMSDTLTGIRRAGGHVEERRNASLFSINGEFTASIVLARCRESLAGFKRWKVRLDTGLEPDVTIAIRMDPQNERALDYYLLPRLDMTRSRLALAEDNGLSLDAYRFQSLEQLFEMATHVRLPEVA